MSIALALPSDQALPPSRSPLRAAASKDAPIQLNFIGRWVQRHYQHSGLLAKIARLILWLWPSLKATLKRTEQAQASAPSPHPIAASCLQQPSSTSATLRASEPSPLTLTDSLDSFSATREQADFPPRPAQAPATGSIAFLSLLPEPAQARPAATDPSIAAARAPSDEFSLEDLGQVPWYQEVIRKADFPDEEWLSHCDRPTRLAALIRQKSRQTAPKEGAFFDLARLFPDRKITAASVQTLTCSELLALKSELFFPIVDLLSAEQAIALLSSDCPLNHKMFIYFYSQALADEIQKRQEAAWNQPIDPQVLRDAWVFYQDAFKFSPQAFTRVLDSSNLLEVMKKSSTTLSLDTSSLRYYPPNFARDILAQQHFHTNAVQDPRHWASAQRELLPKPDLSRIDPAWLTSTHERIVALYELEDRHPRTPGSLNEEISVERDAFYSPGRIVHAQLDHYTQWLRKEIIACEQGRSNPIVVAALACTRLITIHPFQDGNGRLGRFIANCILRHFDLLPSVWEEKRIALHPFGSLQGTATTSGNVAAILQGLKTAYEVVQTSVAGAA